MSVRSTQKALGNHACLEAILQFLPMSDIAAMRSVSTGLKTTVTQCWREVGKKIIAIQQRASQNIPSVTRDLPPLPIRRALRPEETFRTDHYTIRDLLNLFSPSRRGDSNPFGPGIKALELDLNLFKGTGHLHKEISDMIPELARRCPNLEEISIRNSSRAAIQENRGILRALFKSASNLTSLVFWDDAPYGLGEDLLRYCPKLLSVRLKRSFYINSYKFFWGCTGITTLIPYLRELPLICTDADMEVIPTTPGIDTVCVDASYKVEKLTSRGFALLAERLPNLQSLDVTAFCYVQDFSCLKQFKNLTSLTLRSLHGVKPVVRALQDRLQHLALLKCDELDDDTFREIGRCAKLRSLTYDNDYRLNCTPDVRDKLTNDGLLALSGCVELESFTVRSSDKYNEWQWTTNGMITLGMRLPKLEILSLDQCDLRWMDGKEVQEYFAQERRDLKVTAQRTHYRGPDYPGKFPGEDVQVFNRSPLR